MSIRKSDDIANEDNSKYNKLKTAKSRSRITERFDDSTENEHVSDDALQYLNKKLDDVIDSVNDSAGKVASDGVQKLATARTIGGVSFDGTANINLPGVNTEGNQNTTGTATNATNIVVTADNASATHPITFIDDTTPDGSTEGLKASENIAVNPSTGTLTLAGLTISYIQGNGKSTFGTVTFSGRDEAGRLRTATIEMR
tara:strand:- start:801 stop:1400 length:600 start_codon:yes stop_codon:yes gene_type:complete